MPRSHALLSRFWSVTLLLIMATTASAQEPRTLIEWKTQQLSDVFFSEGAAAGDFNKDGNMDVASGPFWYEGPDFKTTHPIYAPKPFDPHGYSDNFFAYTDDFNKDGWADVLVYGFPGQDASWFENPQGHDGLWTRHKVLDVVDNESPNFVDITGDGQRDIVCSSGGFFGFAEVNADDPTQPWTFRKVSDKTAGGRFTHGLGTGDVNNDGRVDILEKTGWWEQPESLDGDPVWKKHAVAFSGPGGAQMYAYDFDGDGDNDVLTSLAAHGYGLAWFENVKQSDDGGIEFEQHNILGSKPADNAYGVSFSQLHGVELADIDGDGIKDVITGKRYWAHGPHGDAEPNAAPVLYWFRTVRSDESVDFVPHLIDDDSGIGTEVKARDLNGDGALDIIVGNKKGTYVSIQSRKEVAQAEWQRAQPISQNDVARPTSDGLPENEGLLPEEAARAMTVPAGFSAQLVAGEPDVHQPIAFTFDDQGRLWLAEAHTYPNRAPEGEGRDRIIILSDDDHDGRFENRKVFTEGLNLVSGLQVGFGGVWVGAAPYFMFIPDNDGNDTPDGDPQILLDGFGYQDTHETLNSFTWGPDGWLYGCHGVFTHSKVGKPGTPDDQRTGLNAGVWRYHPTRHEFEVFAHGTSNPWGVDFDEHGQAVITSCVIPHLFHMIQGGRYHRQGGQHFQAHTYEDIQTIADHFHYAGSIRDHAWWGRESAAVHNETLAAGGGHAHAGAVIYQGDNFPQQYRGTIFMVNIHGNRINNDLLQRDGSGFVGQHGSDFAFANDRWFRGVSLRSGPDGCLYVIDWYDENACHRGDAEIWDRTNGRIYRFAFGQPEQRIYNLARRSTAALIALQTHRNEWHSRTARRLLQERAAAGERIDPAPLLDIVRSHTEIAARLRALWTLHVTSGLSDEVVTELLDMRGPGTEYLRGWAMQLALEDRQLSPPLTERLARLAHDDRSPIVQLNLASALQRLPVDDRWEIADGLVSQADSAHDHNLPLMIWYGVEPLVMADTSRALALAERSRISTVSRFIYRRAASDGESLATLLDRLQQIDEEPRQRLILDEVTNALSKRGRLKMPASWPDVYAKLSNSKADDLRQKAQFITVKFGDKSIFPTLRKIVADPRVKTESRLSALGALLSGQDSELPPLLHRLLSDPAIRSAAIKGLASFDDPQTPAALLEHYARFSDAEQQDAIATLASRASYAAVLLDAIEQKRLPAADLTAFTVRQMQEFEDDALSKKLNEVWGTTRSTPAERRELIEAWEKKLSDAVLAKADRPHGRELFTKTCANCHKLFGEGGEIGPDITGANRTNTEYLLFNMLDPSAQVGRNYETHIVVTDDGRVLTGMIKEENDSAIVLQTAREKVVVPLADIDTRKRTDASLMPEGQLKPMSDDDVRDLVAYLGSTSQVPLPGTGPQFDEQTGRVAGAIEAESMKVANVTGGRTRSQPMDGFSQGRWSGNSQLWWTGGQPKDELVLKFPVRSEGEYEVFAVMTKARDYGIVRLRVHDNAASKPIDLFHAPEVVTSDVISLGTHSLTAGTHQLTVEITGANPQAAKGYMFGLDYLYLSPRPTHDNQRAPAGGG